MNKSLFFILLALFVSISISTSSRADTIILNQPEIHLVENHTGSVNLAGKITPQAIEYVATWTYTGPIYIPDENLNWTIISCDPNGIIPVGKAVTKVEISHSYTHTYTGDLDIQLENDTKLWSIHSSDLDNNVEDIDETITNTTTFTGDDPNQVWFYQFRDVLEDDTGQLNEMTLKVYYANAEPDISLSTSELHIDCSDSQSVSTLAASSSTQQKESTSRLIDKEAINEMFDEQGTARVIVNLKESLVADTKAALVKGKSTKAFRSKVKQVRDVVLDKYKGKKSFKTHHEYDNIPSFSANVTVDQLNDLLAEDNIASIEPARKYKCFTAQGLPLINAFDSRSATTGSGISIAICDTGIDYTHPMLGGASFPNDKVIGGYDFGDDDSDPYPYYEAHGTACAGIAAGFIGSYGDYIGGVAPGAKLYALKVTEGSEEYMYDDSIAASWDWCVTNQYADQDNPIMVISVSLGGSKFSNICDNSTVLLTTAAGNATNAGITIVAASGNEGYCDSISEPACISTIISVGAVYDRSLSSGGWCIDSTSCIAESYPECDTGYICYDTNAISGEVNCYSNSADILDVLAPSYSVTTTDITGSGGYDNSSDYTTGFAGTSAATPYVAGVVAVIQQYSYQNTGSYLSPSEIRNLLVDTGTMTYDPKSDIYTPLINLESALEAAYPCDGESISINNTGGQTLSISGINLPAWLTIDMQFPIEILPNSTLTICLASDCSAVCESEISYSDNITIYSNDPDTPELILPVIATCATCSSTPLGDITGDCLVNLEDMSVIASSWLDCGYYPESYCN